MRKLIVLLAILGLALMAVPTIQASEVLVNLSTDGVGFRDNISSPGTPSPESTLITQGAAFNFSTSRGFRIGWNITAGTGSELGEYEYTYNISSASPDPNNLTKLLPLSVAVKDFYLQVSSNFAIIPEQPPETSPAGSTIGAPTVAGNPFHSLFWTALSTDLNIDATSFTIHFDSTSVPVWGSFYADDGGTNIAHNGDFPNFGNDAFPFTKLDYIPVPNTAVPVPPTAVLLGSGLVGLLLLRRKVKA